MSRPGEVEEVQDVSAGLRDHGQRAPNETSGSHKIPDGHEPLKPEPEEEQAAQLIQRNYRGYRTRRQLQGMGLDASARWAEV